MSSKEDKMINVIGGGLAGCEAAWQLAQRGIKVYLYEMKPAKKSPAHEMDGLAELVCSNSFKANDINTASGLLKEEMRIFGSLIVEAADSTSVPAGGALAVDRASFSRYITEKIESHPNIQVIKKEVLEMPEGINIIATGPLTSEGLSAKINQMTGEGLFFYDAAAPIVSADSIDMAIAFKGSRYGKGEDYINCPMDEAEYDEFYNRLIVAETVPVKGFEDKHVFESCLPIENIAKRGKMTMAFGPLKPVGIINPHTGSRPYAVVQLRQDNREATIFNMVGFQTRLKFGAQKEVFSLIPGLKNAEFLRYGVMHKNIYINSPRLLNADCSLKNDKDIYFAGQIMGVEGYVESAASGLWAGINAALKISGRDTLDPDPQTMTGALIHYCTLKDTEILQPINANYGIISPLNKKVRGKKERRAAYSERAIQAAGNIALNIERQ